MDLTQLQPADFKRWQIKANLSFPCLFFSFWLPSSKQSYGMARLNRPAWFQWFSTSSHEIPMGNPWNRPVRRGRPSFGPTDFRANESETPRADPTERKKTGDGYGDEAHLDIYIYIYVHKLYTYMYMVNIWSIYVEYHENWILGFIGYAIQLSNK